MLKINEKSGFAYVKVAQNSLKSGICAASVGALSLLEFIKTNPRHELNKDYIQKTMSPYLHSDAALSELEKFGYLTKHCYPREIRNVWHWEYEINSFSQSTAPCGILYYDTNGNVTKGCNERNVYPLPVTDKFLMVPKAILLDRSLSLCAKGLFVWLMYFEHNNPNLSSKDLIRREIGMGAYEFNKAWKELVRGGYLLAHKSTFRKYDFIIFPKPLLIENHKNAERAPYKRSFISFSEEDKIKTASETKRACAGTKLNPVYVENEETFLSLLSCNQGYYKNAEKVLLTDHRTPLIECVNKAIVKYLKSTLNRRTDYFKFLESYEFLCSELLYMDEDAIDDKDKYAMGCVVRRFKYLKARKNMFYTDWEVNQIKEELRHLKERQRYIPDCRKKKSKGLFFKHLTQQYDFEALQAFIDAC